MPEIMSAEELSAWLMAREVNRPGIAEISIEERIAMIKNRDKIILDKYKEAIIHNCLMVPGDRWIVGHAIKTLDSAFAEIEGGE